MRQIRHFKIERPPVYINSFFFLYLNEHALNDSNNKD